MASTVPPHLLMVLTHIKSFPDVNHDAQVLHLALHI